MDDFTEQRSKFAKDNQSTAQLRLWRLLPDLYELFDYQNEGTERRHQHSKASVEFVKEEYVRDSQTTLSGEVNQHIQSEMQTPQKIIRHETSKPLIDLKDEVKKGKVVTPATKSTVKPKKK